MARDAAQDVARRMESDQRLAWLRVRDVLRPRDDDDLRLRGTLAPERCASDSPIATGCFGLVTRLPERPDRSFPSFISLIARPTFVRDFAPYFRRPFDFLVGISCLLLGRPTGQRGPLALRVACQRSEHTWVDGTSSASSHTIDLGLTNACGRGTLCKDWIRIER